MHESMHDQEQRNGGWGKMAVACLITFLATSGFWNVLNQYFNNDKPTRGEIKSIMQESSPYMQDRAMILLKLSDLQDGQRETKLEIEKLRGEILAERRSRVR